MFDVSFLIIAIGMMLMCGIIGYRMGCETCTTKCLAYRRRCGSSPRRD